MPYTIPTPQRLVTDAHRADALRALNRPRLHWHVFTEWARILIFAVALFLVIKTFAVEAFKIPTGSMERTLLVGDFLLVNKAAYGAEIPFTHVRLPAMQVPRRRDIIVFEFPEDRTKNYVKRLIGLPGDTVEMRDGDVWLNGHQLIEPYVIHSDPMEDPGGEPFGWQSKYLVRTAEASAIHPSRNNWGPLVVPEGSYFVLGDNRDNSSDSRYWGFVPDSLIKGKPWVVYYSFERDATHRYPWLTNIRWGRLGTRVH